MKSLNGVMKELLIPALSCLLLPSAALGDVSSPPRPLHRVGFEIFGEKPSANDDRTEPSIGKSDDKAPLTVEEEQELQKQVAELKKLFGDKTEMDMDDGKVLKFEDIVQDLRKNFRKYKSIEKELKNGDPLAVGAWKYPRQVTELERTAIKGKLESVKSEMQKRFDVEYAKLDKAGLLKGIGLCKDEYEYRYRRVKLEISEENALTVVKSILGQDEGLRLRCEGIPIEWLSAAMKCPEPSLDEKALKRDFRSWAVRRMPRGLNVAERNRVFLWQFFVVEKERRPWKDLLLAENKAQERVRSHGWMDESARRNQKESVRQKAFEDFEPSVSPAADYVITWYDKAVAAGMTPADEDRKLLSRAQFDKKPWAGNANIVISDGKFGRRKIKIHGVVSQHDLEEARNALLGGLGADEQSGFDVDLDEPDGQTLMRFFEVFLNDSMIEFSVRGDGASRLDISGLAKGSAIRSVNLKNCMVGCSVRLSGCRKLERFRAKDCVLGDLAFLSGCTALKEIEFDDCSFSGLGNLWPAEWMRELSVPNSKSVVDLAVVQKLEHLSMLDISGCSVTNFTALKGHPSLCRLKMEHVKGGVGTLAFLADNPELRYVEYLTEDLNPSVYRDYARAMRKKNHRDDPKRMLSGAVEDRDLPEIRRLCGAVANTDDALWRLEPASADDMDIIELLLPKASQRTATELLKKCISMFGYGNYYTPKTSFIPTNRTEVVMTLLKCGANPDDAMKDLAYPAEEDLEWFKLMLDKTSGKVRTELLQKNIKSFGSDPTEERRSGSPVDRLAVIRLLLKNGADPNARNFFGNTSLGNAIEHDGDMALVRLLLENGADASLLYPKMELFRGFYQGRDNLWGTNRHELVELLVAHGLDVNAKGRFGKTPLGEVVFFGNTWKGFDLKMAALLLKHGADPNASQGDKLGSATDLAYGKIGAEELVALLQKHGGKVSEEAKRKKSEMAKEKESEPDARPRRVGEEELRSPDHDRRWRGWGHPDGNMDSIREEMDRFHEEMRNCTDHEQRRKLMEKHSKRMREIHGRQPRF